MSFVIRQYFRLCLAGKVSFMYTFNLSQCRYHRRYYLRHWPIHRRTADRIKHILRGHQFLLHGRSIFCLVLETCQRSLDHSIKLVK